MSFWFWGYRGDLRIELQAPVLSSTNPLYIVILIKWNISFVTEVLEQPERETHKHNVVVIREWRHSNINKQELLLADIDITPPSGAV